MGKEYIQSGYTAQGRVYDVYEDGQPTGKKIYKSRIGEQNVEVEGAFFPYYVDGDRILYGKDAGEIVFEAGQQVLKHAGSSLVSSSKFFVQAMVGNQWVNQLHGTPTRNIKHNYPNEGDCTGYLDFPDATTSFGKKLAYELQVGMTVGPRKNAKLGFRFRGPASGQIRFAWVNDGIEKLLDGDYEWIYLGGGRRKDIRPEKRKVGIKFKGITFRWTYAEAAQRSFEIVENADGSRKITTVFGPFDYTANEWLEVSPDTWGATETSDDCEEDDKSKFYDNYYGNLYVGKGNDPYIFDIGLTFSNVTVPAGSTAENGCYISGLVDYELGDGADTLIKVIAARSIGAWSSSNRPSQKTKHTTTVGWNNVGNSEVGNRINSPELKTLLQQRFDGTHVSGDDIGITIENNNSPDLNQVGFVAEETGAGMELTIVYTPAGAGSFTGAGAGLLRQSGAASRQINLNRTKSGAI